jgi:hypothetical protein
MTLRNGRDHLTWSGVGFADIVRTARFRSRNRLESRLVLASHSEPDWNQLDEWFAAIEALRESTQPAL